MISSGEEYIYLLATVFWHTEDHEALHKTLTSVRKKDELIFSGLSDAYHGDIRLIKAVHERRTPPPVAAIVFLDLAMQSRELPGQMERARAFLPSAVFVLYGDANEYKACMDELPLEWANRFAVYYRLTKTPRDTLASRIRRVLDEARDTAIRKRDAADDQRGTIFLSYSRDDKELADKLAFWMRVDGYRVWQDDSELAGGEDWMDAVGNALRESEVLVLVLSEDALTSRYVKYEYRHFFNEGKPIIPVLARHMNQLPPELETTQWIDFTDDDPWLVYPKLSRAVNKVRGGQKS